MPCGFVILERIAQGIATQGKAENVWRAQPSDSTTTEFGNLAKPIRVSTHSCPLQWDKTAQKTCTSCDARCAIASQLSTLNLVPQHFWSAQMRWPQMSVSYSVVISDILLFCADYLCRPCFKKAFYAKGDGVFALSFIKRLAISLLRGSSVLCDDVGSPAPAALQRPPVQPPLRCLPHRQASLA